MIETLGPIQRFGEIWSQGDRQFYCIIIKWVKFPNNTSKLLKYILSVNVVTEPCVIYNTQSISNDSNNDVVHLIY